MLLLALALVACALGLQELQVDAMGRAGDAEAQARVLHAGGPGLGRAGDAEAQARVLQAGGPGLLTLHIPFAGSLAPIWGNLALPPGSAAQPAQYKLCVYLESIAAGQALYNGPKPQENADSYAPILADGSFLFVGWFANYALDPVTPFIIGHAFPNSLGQCLPILGTPANAAYPGLMNAQSIAYASLARVNTLSLALAAGSPFSDDTAGSFALTIQGIPPDPIDFMVLVYFSTDGGATLSGPAPDCSAGAAFIPDSDGKVSIPLGAALVGVPDLYFVLVSAAVTVSATPLLFMGEVIAPVVCGEALVPLAGAALPSAVAGLQLALLHLQRTPRPPTPSVSPTRTLTPTRTPTPRPTIDAPSNDDESLGGLDISEASALRPHLWPALVAVCAAVAAAFAA